LTGVFGNLDGHTTNAGQFALAQTAAASASTLATQTIPADEANVQSAFTAGQNLDPSVTQLMNDVHQLSVQLITANTSSLNAGASPASLTNASTPMLTAAGDFLALTNDFQTFISQGESAQQAITNALAAFPPPPGADPPSGSGSVVVLDATTGVQMSAPGSPYTGPVAGLQQQYINLTSDNLNIAASTPGWFIHSGAGMDAISVSSGTNVLDGGTNSNFLAGGSGTDTFYVDDRNPSADIWSTVENMHAGDAATVWGVTPQNFSLTWQDNQGAAGFTGLTLHAMAAGMPTASLTLAGYSTADLNNGRLSVSFGTEGGNPYMYIHA
jgi:hypothetical protein